EGVRSRVRHIEHEQPIGHTLLEVPGSPPPSFAGIEDRHWVEGEKKRKHMAASYKGRRSTGHDAVATIRLSSELRESVDAWAAKQSDKPARPEAILRLVELGLKTTHRRESAPNRAAKASELAAEEVDRISDPSATEEERQLRKRRLIKGPKEFRDNRKKSGED